MDDNGNFYLSFECDSLIYVYDNRYTIKYSFGFEGIGMNLDYLTLRPGKEYVEQCSQERKNKGYYTSIKKIGDNLFRTYKTGNNADYERLQIYQNRTLVGDVEVPNGFRVMGYLAPYFYSHIIADEDRETLTMYKFALEL